MFGLEVGQVINHEEMTAQGGCQDSVGMWRLLAPGQKN